MRSREKRASAACRRSAGSSASARSIAAAMSRVVVDDEPVRPSSIDFGHGAAPRRDHRRAACHRLDHDEAERLLPVDREERRARVLQQLDLLAVRHLTEVLDLPAQVRLDELVEVLQLRRLAALARELQRQTGLVRDRDRAMRALVVLMRPRNSRYSPRCGSAG